MRPMNIDAFLFLQRSDIAHYMASGLNLGPIPHIFIDPGLVDEAVKLGIDPQHFSYRPLQVGPRFQARVLNEAMARASVIDHALTTLRHELFGDGAFHGWDHLHMRQFMTRALVAKYLGELAERSLPETRIGLFRPTVPQLYYFDSFLATDLFVGKSNRWRIVDHYDKALNWMPDHAAFCFDFGRIAQMASDGHAQAVTHLPTCYQNGARYIAEIQQRFTHNIDLPSVLWDIPVRRSGAMHRRIDSLSGDNIRNRAFIYRERARHILNEQIAPLLVNQTGLDTQVDMLADRCFMQAVNYDGLLDALRGTQPHFVVTDHDTGHNGPIFSVAAKLDAPITVVPHSSHPVAHIPHPLQVTAIDQDGFQTPLRTVLDEKVRMKSAQLVSVTQPIVRSQIKTICLLFNTMFSQGVAHIDFAGMARFYDGLAALCDSRDINLIVRLKPNGAAPLMASSALRIPADTLHDILKIPLGQLAQASDLCVSYGEPTSAGIDFLSVGSYLIHSSNQIWPSDFWAAPSYIGDSTVPVYTDAEALLEIEALLSNTAYFTQCADQQRSQFTSHLTAKDGHIFDPL